MGVITRVLRIAEPIFRNKLSHVKRQARGLSANIYEETDYGYHFVNFKSR